MIRYKCTVAYVGANYCGWQTQKNGNSVQEYIESALERIFDSPVRIMAAGRTDAGVSAWGQVFQFDSEKDIGERKLMGAINGFLPKDIHIRKVEKKDQLFHVRYCVKSKQYDYRINLGEYNVFTRDSAYQCPYPVDVTRMEEAAQYFVGTHDFTSFNSNTLKETPDQVRTIESITFHQDGDMLTISYRGRGFLRYMVRMMTAALLEVGRGRMEPENIKVLLEAKSKTVVRRNAHPEGLTLKEITYFDVLAETSQLTVREVLPEDEASLEGMPFGYVLADRHTDQVYGGYEEGPAGAVITLFCECDAQELAVIREQLLDRQKQQGRMRGMLVILREERTAETERKVFAS
ncbi:MAG: tRNA pseudouridine(38-40) synthase TruA [Solobacterium sp.]|nr:tRNA pseudouridine(38-40) synthase TruA [Solobacterium sp.]